jgi:hypothetical protein
MKDSLAPLTEDVQVPYCDQWVHGSSDHSSSEF